MDLNQVTLPVSDVERSVSFYKALGLKQIVQALPHYARFECPSGNSTLSLQQTDILPSTAGIWVYFEVDELDRRVQDLVSMGFSFEELPEDKPWLWREARLKDPDNHQLILYQAGTNIKYPPWRILS